MNHLVTADPDCSNCGHPARFHGVSTVIYRSCTFPGAVGCGCQGFVPTVAAPLTKDSASGEGQAACFLLGLWEAGEGLGVLREALPAVQALGRPAGREDEPAHAAGVRRLTPREAERLQGLPDDWTKLDGKTPDSRRYSALGDAVTATVSEWIGRRLLEQSAPRLLVGHQPRRDTATVALHD